MAHVFASYLAEVVPPTPVEGTYDPEQELWIGNNQALAAQKNPGSDHGGSTATTTKTCNIKVYATLLFDIGTYCENDTQSDSD